MSMEFPIYIYTYEFGGFPLAMFDCQRVTRNHFMECNRMPREVYNRLTNNIYIFFFKFICLFIYRVASRTNMVRWSVYNSFLQ